MSLKRILKFAWNDFSRNWASNIVVIFVMVLVISLASSLFIFQGIADYLIETARVDIDVSVFFREEVTEEEIKEVKQGILEITEIKEVSYVSKEEALERFKERHQNNPFIIEALEEIGENPFLSYLTIRTETAEQYESILIFLERSDYGGMIDDVDYLQKRPVIERLSIISLYVGRIGIGIAIILSLIAVLVVFNAIKLAIYDSKEEISTMKLVGASNWFIRGPFIIQGALYGLIAFLFTFSFFVIFSYFLTPYFSSLFWEFDLFEYFITNIGILVLIQLLLGVGLGIVSSLIVIRKHLKV